MARSPMFRFPSFAKRVSCRPGVLRTQYMHRAAAVSPCRHPPTLRRAGTENREKSMEALGFRSGLNHSVQPDVLLVQNDVVSLQANGVQSDKATGVGLIETTLHVHAA